MELTATYFGYEIPFTVVQSDGVTAEDLTGVESIRFLVAEIDTYRNILSGACVVVDAVNGTCKYTVQKNDFEYENTGNFNGVIEITYSITKKVPSKEFFVTIKKPLKTS